MALYDVLGNLIAGGTLFADAPVGVINPFGGANAPEGWLLCDGQAISRTDYADLFDVIGTAFGSGDGSTTFNVPDFRGEFIRGAGTNSHSGQGNGGSVGTHQDATLQAASMASSSYNDIYALNTDGTNFINSDATRNVNLVGYSRVNISLNSGGSCKAMVMRPTNTSVNFIIKAKHVSLPADFLAEIQEILDSKNILTYGSD